MKMSYRIDGGIVRLIQSGEFDIETYIGVLAHVVADPAHHPAMPVITDVRGLLSQVDFSGMQKIREALVRGPLQSFRPRRYALLTPAPMYDMMAKLYSEAIIKTETDLAGAIEIRSFATSAQAEAWVRSGG